MLILILWATYFTGSFSCVCIEDNLVKWWHDTFWAHLVCNTWRWMGMGYIGHNRLHFILAEKGWNNSYNFGQKIWFAWSERLKQVYSCKTCLKTTASLESYSCVLSLNGVKWSFYSLSQMEGLKMSDCLFVKITIGVFPVFFEGLAPFLFAFGFSPLRFLGVFWAQYISLILYGSFWAVIPMNTITIKKKKKINTSFYIFCIFFPVNV